VAIGHEQLDDRLVAVRLLEVEDCVELALRVVLARGGTVVLGRRATLDR
jgi:hypothetical protein